MEESTRILRSKKIKKIGPFSKNGPRLIGVSMEQAIRERYNKDILAETAGRYGVKPDQIQLLDSFESFIFEFEKNGKPLILRLSHSIRRSKNMILGEVDWINYLAGNGLGVAQALPSPGDELVELIEDGHGGQFLATTFEKAPGGSAWQMGQWNERLFENYGRFIGRMHILSTRYKCPNAAWKRPEWDDPDMFEISDWLPEDEPLVCQRAEEILRYLRSLPKDAGSYGLVHQDAHGGNFFVDETGRITLFDFDDCVYSWFVYDIAMVLFYAITNQEDPEGFGKQFWSQFWSGYRAEFDLDPLWLAQIRFFMKLREVDLYAVIHRSYDVDNMADSWARRFMAGRREKIENELRYVNIDFAALSA